MFYKLIERNDTMADYNQDRKTPLFNLKYGAAPELHYNIRNGRTENTLPSEE